MRTLILSKLDNIEQAYGIKILYSCESGSRGWQFPSPDSDYDVRFIYIRPVQAYLSVTDTEGHIMLPVNDELDIYGWDIRKVLQLMRKSNTTPFEWMQSPIVYKEEAGFRNRLQQLALQYFDAKTHACHYLGIVKKLSGGGMEEGSLTIKAFFYVLRSLLSAKWNLEKGTIAPLTIDGLLELLPAALQVQVRELVSIKAVSAEKQAVNISEALQHFINTETVRCNEAVSALQKHNFNAAALNTFFVKTLEQYDHQRYKREGLAAAGMY